jgi:acetate---CoA ligase (ADP-forming) subunit beta
MSVIGASADALQALRMAREKGWQALDEPSGKAILAAVGIPVPASRVIAGPDELGALAGLLRAPYVLKAVAPEIIHKSEYGAVKIGLKSMAEAESALATMRSGLAERGITVHRWLVEEMAPAGIECVVGGMMDPEFGPMVMVGLGGVFVEIMRDVAFRICPIERQDADEMIHELKGVALLKGARGREPVSLDALIDALLKLGGTDGIMMRCADEVSEVDINPLIVTSATAIAADARFIFATGAAKG